MVRPVSFQRRVKIIHKKTDVSIGWAISKTFAHLNVARQSYVSRHEWMLRN